jgi:hypothetical protein
MSRTGQLQTLLIIGLGLGFILIASGAGVNWVSNSRIDLWALGELLFVALLLGLLIRMRLSQKPPQ